MTSKSKLTRGGIVAVLIGLFVIGMFYLQSRYIAHRLPLIRSALAAAEVAGPKLLKEVGVPPGATALSPVEMTLRTDGEESMWGDEPVGAEWTALWDAPGDRAGIDAWYKGRLLADGWKIFGDPVHNDNQFWKGKWLLTIEHRGDFSKERPPHVETCTRLEWGFLHALESAGR